MIDIQSKKSRQPFMTQTNSKIRKKSQKGIKNDSMVLMMSNLMTKRKPGGKRKAGQSQKVGSDFQKQVDYHQNNFYF